MRPLSSLTFKLVAALVVATGVALVVPACGGGGSGTPFGTPTGAGGNTASSTGGAGGVQAGAGGGGGGLFNTTTGTGPAQKLQVMPATATITVQNGVVMPVDFAAEVGGNMVGAAWQIDLTSVATVDGGGKVTATGNVGGQLTLTATYGGQKATAKVTVHLKKLMNPGGLSGVAQTSLVKASMPDAAIQWAYPYNGTVFPKGLLAPEMMWNGGGAGDAYYIHFTGKYVDFEVFTTADPPSRYTLDGASWTQLTESGDGGAVKVHVARQPAGAPTAGVAVDHTWTIANGSLRGIVYYWANSLGRVLRIKPGATTPDDFLALGGDSTCSTCHAVSADGSTMLIGGDATISTWDLKTNAPVYNINPGSVPNGNRPWAMAAISPDGSVMVENNAPLPGPPGGSDGMFDTHTGARVPNSGLDGVVIDMPSFGADGSKLAYVDHGNGNLGYYTFDPVKHEVSNATTLVTPGNNPSIAWPAASPDAKWVVYARSTLDSRSGPGDLYLASILNPGVDIRLAGVDGDSYPFAAGGRDQHYNYEPNFAPLNSGGFAWVVFTSRRTYGNRLTGDPTVTKQIWVTAIDQNPAAGADPSHPAFWVTGQDQTTLNMRAFWALEPCRATGMMCDQGSECCNQNCESSLCSKPVPNQCSQDGNHCDKTSDCCKAATGTTCINHICSEPAPH